MQPDADPEMNSIPVNIIMESPATFVCTLTNIYIVNVANYMPITHLIP